MGGGVAAMDSSQARGADPDAGLDAEGGHGEDVAYAEARTEAQVEAPTLVSELQTAVPPSGLPMDESEYRDEVDNEFVRGRMENVVRVATGDDIRVTFGDGCHTDMKGTVQVDPHDLGENAPPEDRIIMMQGGLEHEICHELYYDKRAFEELQKQVGADPSRSQVVYLNNVLVDGHDEWRHKLDRPEAYEMIEAHDALWVGSNGSGRWSFDPDHQDTWRQVTGAMLYRGLPYYRVPEEKLSPEAIDAYRECSPHVDAAVAGTSWDCLREANEIHDILKRRGIIPERPANDHLGGGAGPGSGGPPGPGQPQGQGQSQPQGQGQDASGDGSSGGETSGGTSGGASGELDRPLTDEEKRRMTQSGAPLSDDGSENGNGASTTGSTTAADRPSSEATGNSGGNPGESPAGDGAAPGSHADASSFGSGGQPGGSSDGSSSGSGSLADESGGASTFAASDEAGKEALENRRGQARSLAASARNHKPQSSHRDDPHESVARTPEALSEFRERWSRHRRTARQFADVIEEARTETLAPKSRQESGRLDRSRRRALAVGDAKVFTRRGKARKADMSVELLLDVSSSMSGNIPELKDSAAVISQGLDGAGIAHEVRGFGRESSQPLYRAFGEKADWKLGAIETAGTTALDRGMEKVRGGFAGRQEKQKLALVMTDGRPNDVDDAKAQLAQARREGVTVVGIFLRPDLKRPEYDHFSDEDRTYAKAQIAEAESSARDLFGGKVAVIDDVRQLPKVAGKKIVDLLRRER